jgi:hypothetical protein
MIFAYEPVRVSYNRSCSIKVFRFSLVAMKLVEQTCLYEPVLPTSKNIVPLNLYQADGSCTVNQYLVKIDFCQVYILRSAVVAELKLQVRIVLTQAYASPGFQVDRIDSSFCRTPVIWYQKHFFRTPASIVRNEAKACNFQHSENC